MPLHRRMRVIDRDLIRGGHYGQRSCEPHLKAEHMAAPTSLRREVFSCQLGAVHTWHKADMNMPDPMSAFGSEVSWGVFWYAPRNGRPRRARIDAHYPCFAARCGGMSDGRENQGWRDCSHTAIDGAGKSGSAKLPMATATYPGKPSLSQ